MEILIIDDEPTIISTLIKSLNRWGYEARSAENALDALKILSTDPVDLILLDVYLKETTAIELIPKIKSIKPTVNIITMTGQTSRELELEIRSFGILYYMAKPIEIANLKSILEHIDSRVIAQ